MSPTDPYPLELQDVSCVFGDGPRRVVALDGVSLSLKPGELVAVMGPSGSGKSTLLNVAGLLQPPTSGRVLIDGVDAAGPRDRASAQVPCGSHGDGLHHPRGLLAARHGRADL